MAEGVQGSAALGLAAQAVRIARDLSPGPWLLERLASREVARVAFEANVLVIGVEPTGEIESKAPKGYEINPTDDAQEGLALDPDQGLPWPSPGMAQGWWEVNDKLFTKGVRHLLGRPMAADHLQDALRTKASKHTYKQLLANSPQSPAGTEPHGSDPGNEQEPCFSAKLA